MVYDIYIYIYTLSIYIWYMIYICIHIIIVYIYYIYNMCIMYMYIYVICIVQKWDNQHRWCQTVAAVGSFITIGTSTLSP